MVYERFIAYSKMRKLSCYLKYRVGKKVYTDYLGKEGEKVAGIRAGIEKRRHIEAMIANLQTELAIAKKMLEERE